MSKNYFYLLLSTVVLPNPGTLKNYQDILRRNLRSFLHTSAKMQVHILYTLYTLYTVYYTLCIILVRLLQLFDSFSGNPEICRLLLKAECKTFLNGQRKALLKTLRAFEISFCLQKAFPSFNKPRLSSIALEN